MISLDLSRAFDCLTRQALASALASAHVPPDLSQAIIDIHNQCRYKVAHHRYEGRFDMRVGVRQAHRTRGCENVGGMGTGVLHCLCRR